MFPAMMKTLIKNLIWYAFFLLSFHNLADEYIKNLGIIVLES